MSDELLIHKSIKGFAWIFSGELMKQAAKAVVTVAFARLLLPAEFGVIVILVMYMGCIDVIGEIGFSGGIIQKKHLDDTDLNTAFYGNIVMGAFLYGIAYVSAPFVAGWFGRQYLVPFLRLLSLRVAINAFVHLHQAVFRRKLEFHKAVIPAITAIAVYGIGSCLILLTHSGVYGFIVCVLCSSFAGAVTTYILLPWTPGLPGNLKKAGELLRFGGAMVGERIVKFIRENVDYWIVGKYFGPVILGQYYLAYELAHFWAIKVAPLISKVLFPVLSTVSSGEQEIQTYYLTSLVWMTGISFPVLLVIAVTSKPFIVLLYGPQWAASAGILPVLCLLGFIKTIGRTAGSVFYARGRADIMFYWSCIAVGTDVLAIMIGKQYGILGISLALTVKYIMMIPFLLRITNRLIHISFARYMECLVPVVSAGVFAGIIVFIVSRFIPHTLWGLGVEWGIASVFYFLTLFLFGWDVRQGIARVYQSITA